VNRHTDFFAAIEAGDLSTAEALLGADPDLVHARDKNGATALHLAAFHAHRHLVEFLARPAPTLTPEIALSAQRRPAGQ